MQVHLEENGTHWWELYGWSVMVWGVSVCHLICISSMFNICRQTVTAEWTVIHWNARFVQLYIQVESDLLATRDNLNNIIITKITSVGHVRGQTPFFFAKLWQKKSIFCCHVYCCIYRRRNTKKGIKNVTWDLDISSFLRSYLLDSPQRERIWFSNVFSDTNTGFWTWSRLYLKEPLILSTFFCNGSLALFYMSHIFECSTTASGTVCREASGCFHVGR